jgi:hypothetical protein
MAVASCAVDEGVDNGSGIHPTSGQDGLQSLG